MLRLFDRFLQIFTLGWPLIAVMLLLILPGAVFAAPPQITLDDYSNGISSDWTSKEFKGQTKYSLTSIDGQPCIKAESRGTASGLIYKIKYAPADYPFISWKWRIEHTLVKGDVSKKSGDDYAARIYVIFPAFLFWQTKVLNYIWANKMTVGDIQPSTYTKNAAMIAVESGSQKAGQWVLEKRNIVADFTRAFGEPPPKVGAISIMTDTDNTGESTSACYGPVILSKNQ